jgi:hypothetical protein
MSIESMIIANHLNEIEAGRPPELCLDPGHDRMPIEFLATKNAVILRCMLFGLNKMIEIIDREMRNAN